MVTNELPSWAEYRQAVDAIEQKHTRHHEDIAFRGVVYRGLANADWPLATTLERSSSKKLSIASYMEDVADRSDELQSFTGRDWQLPEWSDMKAHIAGFASQSPPFPLPCLDYLVYLRHHGFPSPLLDWTQSPFVAAYFAFYEIPAGTDRVAVNAYVEAPHGAKLASIAEPTIYKTSATATTDRRHFMQQAVYTVAAEQVDGNRMQFCPHAHVFERDHPAQDLLYRITLPATERRAALRDLARSNINHFTLFQDEDALVRSLAMKTFDLQEYPA